MEPRNKSSKPQHSTNFPPEYLEKVRQVFNEGFKKQLKGKKILVEGRLFKKELILSVGFKPDPKGLRQINFEASIDHSGDDVFKKVSVCVDAISSMMAQYFEAGSDIDFPKKWTEFPFEDDKIFLQTSGRNTELENEANVILGEAPSDVLYSEGSTAEKAAEELEELLEGELDETEEDWPEPTPPKKPKGSVH